MFTSGNICKIYGKDIIWAAAAEWRGICSASLPPWEGNVWKPAGMDYHYDGGACACTPPRWICPSDFLTGYAFIPCTHWHDVWRGEITSCWFFVLIGGGMYAILITRTVIVIIFLFTAAGSRKHFASQDYWKSCINKSISVAWIRPLGSSSHFCCVPPWSSWWCISWAACGSNYWVRWPNLYLWNSKCMLVCSIHSLVSIH